MCNPRCGSPRFFDYSSSAPDQFKADLESSFNWYDMANDGMTYTPLTANFVIAIVGAIQTQTNQLDITRAGIIFGTISLVVTITSGFITGIFKTISYNSESTASTLITQGKNNGYFNQAPTAPLAIPPLSISPNQRIS
jgi:hypothetical protein